VGLSIAGPQEAGDAGSGFGSRDGTLGFWAAVRDGFPETRHQRDWAHKTANVLDALPKGAHVRAKKAVKEITEAETRPKPRRR
jgi:putative transposase